MANRRSKGVSASLTPTPQEEEKARVLKPDDRQSAQPKQGESIRTRAPESTMTEEERKQAQKERMDKLNEKRQAKSNLNYMKSVCSNLLRYISNLKWQNNTIGQGHIIKWNSNSNYSAIEIMLNDCLNLVVDMNAEQLQQYADFLQRMADAEVYKYPEEMLKSSYQYDEQGLSNGAVGKAFDNMKQCYAYAQHLFSNEINFESYRESIMRRSIDKALEQEDISDYREVRITD